MDFHAMSLTPGLPPCSKSCWINITYASMVPGLIIDRIPCNKFLYTRDLYPGFSKRKLAAPPTIWKRNIPCTTAVTQE
jgi:hypothetical protein